MSIDGVTFGDAWSRRVTTAIDGIDVLFISKADLKIAKRAAGRTKDLADFAALEEVD